MPWRSQDARVVPIGLIHRVRAGVIFGVKRSVINSLVGDLSLISLTLIIRDGVNNNS